MRFIPRLRAAAMCTAAILFAFPAGTQAATDSVVTFNELHYHPADPVPPETVAAPEWIELHNPMSIGIALWATGHLLANGKRTAVYLFGMFLVVALADIIMSELRGKRPTHEPRLRSDIVAVIAGMVLYVIFLFGFHPYVLNLPVTG